MAHTRRFIQFPGRLPLLAAILATVGFAASCGGGGSGGGTAGVAGLSGVVAVGAPLAGAQVQFLCAAGSPAATTTTATGAFNAGSSGVTFPCVATASGGTVNGAPNLDTLYAAVTEAGTANVTSLSTLQLGYLTGRDLSAWLADMRAAPGTLGAAISSARLATALDQLKAGLATLPTPLSLPAGFDPVRTAFTADGVHPADQLLDQLKASLAAGGAGISDAVAQLGSAQPLVERTPATFSMVKIGGFTHSGGLSSAEILAYDPLSKRLFTVNGALGTVDVLDLTDPTAPVLAGTISSSSFGAGLGGINSVAVHKGVVALAIEASPKTGNGIVALLRAKDLAPLGTATAGALPDMITFTPDGRHLLVANEGEPNSYGQPDSVDPEGSVTIVAVSELSPTVAAVTMTPTNVGFTAFNGQMAALRAAGVRLFGPGATVAQDLEPESIAVSPDGQRAYVTLQENNAIAVIDIPGKSVLSIKPLGLKDHSLPANKLDVSNEDGGTNTNTGTPSIKIASYPIKGMYMPDGVAAFSVGGATYLITANEGDSREYTGINVTGGTGREDPRVRDFCNLGVDPAVFPDTTITLDSNLGRLRVTGFPNGDRTGKNASGQCNELLAFGARSFSIWNSDVAQVWDSGDQLEQRTAALMPTLFNASNDNSTLDDRSPAKGPEPEGVAIGRIGTKTFAFIGLERVGGVMVYDVSTPTAPVYVTYLNTRTGATGDRGPEGRQFVRAAHSPNGKPLLIVGNETSGTTAIFQLNLSY